MSADGTVEFLIPAEDREEALAKLLAFLLICLPGFRLLITVVRARNKRSDPQNRALWGLAYPPLMEFMGMRGERDRLELHDYFCGEYFGWVDYTVMSQQKQRPRRSTTKNEDGKREVMNTMDFMDFFAFIQQRAAEQGVYIPDPDPEWFLKEKAA